MSKERDDALEQVFEHLRRFGCDNSNPERTITAIRRSLKGPSPSHDHSECERELRIARAQNALASPSPVSGLTLSAEAVEEIKGILDSVGGRSWASDKARILALLDGRKAGK